ncbi:hypothetical protein R3P38DRAFT_2800064 [Favolaschia claudopus]|uniref:Uncharacterized protein n=1 Tax=Favolaschia claudopus TaxID=2862362 RepID=A0AAV9ZZA2_9AGAR
MKSRPPLYVLRLQLEVLLPLPLNPTLARRDYPQSNRGGYPETLSSLEAAHNRTRPFILSAWRIVKLSAYFGVAVSPELQIRQRIRTTVACKRPERQKNGEKMKVYCCVKRDSESRVDSRGHSDSDIQPDIWGERGRVVWLFNKPFYAVDDAQIYDHCVFMWGGAIGAMIRDEEHWARSSLGVKSRVSVAELTRRGYVGVSRDAPI